MKVGFWMSDKKWAKLNVCLLEKLLSERGHQLVRLDMEVSLEEQGPFGAIVHKVSDEIAKADQCDVSAQKRLQAFEAYVSGHPEVAVVDPMNGVRVLMDRQRVCTLVAASDIVKQGIVYAPPFVELTSNDVTSNMQRLVHSGVRFPLVCKPVMAHGHGGAHLMSLVFNGNGLKDVKCPCVAQSFINHNALLYKLFIIRDKYYVVERPSLKNFEASDEPTIHFDTHTISKPDSSSSLTELDEETSDMKHEAASTEIFDKIVSEFGQKLGLSLFGIDVIVERGTGKHAIIDMNVFPGYDGVPSFLEDLSDMISDEIKRKEDAKLQAAADSRQISKAAKAKLRVEGTNDNDSGIDTSDSCDEKKPKDGPRRKVKI